VHSGKTRTVRLTSPGQSAVQPNGYLSRHKVSETTVTQLADRPPTHGGPSAVQRTAGPNCTQQLCAAEVQVADRPPTGGGPSALNFLQRTRTLLVLLCFFTFACGLSAPKGRTVRGSPGTWRSKPRLKSPKPRCSKPRLTSPKPRMTSPRRPRLTSADPGAKPRRSSPG
jgi:hypothetical protein